MVKRPPGSVACSAMSQNPAAPTLAAPDDDPWLWLEEVEGDRATLWADAQTAATLKRFGGAPWEADAQTLRTLLDRPDKLPIPARRGGLLYNFWQDASHPRGLWRRTTMADYQGGNPAWDVLLNVDALAEAEEADWTWQGAATLPPEHHRAIIRLSRGGSDAATLREFDLAARRFVEDGFSLAESKGGASYLDIDTLLLSTASLGATRSGYSSTVRLWRRGEAPGEPIFQTDLANMSAWSDIDRRDNRLMFGEALDFYNFNFYLGDRTGPKLKFDLPTDAAHDFSHGWLVVRPRSPWTVCSITYPPDTLLGIGLDAFLAGDRAFTTLFEPTPRRALQGFSWAGDTLLVSILDELQPVFQLVTPGTWAARELDLPRTGTANAWGLDLEDEEADGTLLALTQDPLTPPTLLLMPPGLAAPTVLRHAPAAFDASGLVVTRHEAISSDGERIPYTQSGPPGETGDAPVHLSGYGGFKISRLPSYSIATGKLWLERGGTAVVANIRGGGEFGTRWHEAGRGARKRGSHADFGCVAADHVPRLSHDDFAAVAADLVRRGVTKPGRIAAEGGSNGGLLIANMLTRYPERFGALFCTIPLIDMRRYSKLLAGASWVAEYGDPDDSADWSFLGPMSAYHAAEAGRPYPPMLLATTRRDDRVHPGHARKMAAKLQALGYDAHFYEPAAGGHGYGKDNGEMAAFVALGMRFLSQSIGWNPLAQ